METLGRVLCPVIAISFFLFFSRGADHWILSRGSFAARISVFLLRGYMCIGAQQLLTAFGLAGLQAW